MSSYTGNAGEVAFTYDKALQKTSIRLLKVILDPEPSTLTIQLLEGNLERVEFEALSYVWGDQRKKVPIRCNGKRLEIGANLHAALLERRRRRSATVLWADQICINQDDIEEKTRQVRLMSTIYSKANRVIIWLGMQDPGDIDGLNLMQDLYKKCDGNQYDADVGIYDFHDFDCESRGVPNPVFDPTWVALFKILSNSWFGRVWVIQELLSAQKSVMWKGSLDLSTNVVLWMAMLIGRHKNLYENYDVTMGSPQVSALMARNIAASYFKFRKRGPLPIYDTLSRQLGMSATDPRDRFFALFGVSTGLAKAFVDYKKTFKEVACLVGKMTLLGIPNYRLTEDGTEVLILESTPGKHRFLIEWLAFHANPQNRVLGIPSWVPDLVSPHSSGLLMTGFYNSLHLQEWRSVPNPEVRMGEQFHKIPGLSTNRWQITIPSEIEIKGAIFDQVQILTRDRPPLPKRDLGTVSDHMEFFSALEEVSRYETEMVYWLSEIRMLADPTLSATGSIMDGPSFDAFWRTLLYNRGPRFDYNSPNQQADGALAIAFGYWYLWKKLQISRRWKDDLMSSVIYDRLLQTLAGPFEEAEGKVRHARRFFVSRLGRIGWAPFGTQVGDRVCVFQGMRIPMILRPANDLWEIIGACYVHGLMDGELWDLSDLCWTFMRFM
ncbi:hypothetical protein HBH56_017690 [Parastagonospora nodorum]|uniref:Heterokaryon incompatibility domain-containing protein n=1 Tax=Phaeosphaeria nodorum (strain SN15 / ATCC MYA-4574 / FGSC 10173) TaxID=321614 RepID=A0A7U2F0C8_PHANO|nr:hypothetical protein HBH56_017690 [Parastagonospora nodorum]QRC95208.1 hypothetical protein JI435_029150 [Parastagonospora nodorum SN15]KAH3936911.1 hypothetical protein HBH54_016790 [Parastagonospora nodorum]KAH3953704.1 hypothetical protein HBH53_028890 [Parastagonospora nodorum]KAH4137182.1 hypothetical protein HBH45_124000 [Parastagonospora nodorum]